VLLVHDRDGQRVELDVLLDQRMCPHHQRELAASQLAQGVGTSRGRGRPGEQRHRHRLPRHQRLQGGEVLLGERLGGGHQGGLSAVLDRAQHREEGDHRLPGPHLAHQQPLHRA
jgi:hypothetical protein